MEPLFACGEMPFWSTIKLTADTRIQALPLFVSPLGAGGHLQGFQDFVMQVAHTNMKEAKHIPGNPGSFDVSMVRWEVFGGTPYSRLRVAQESIWRWVFSQATLDGAPLSYFDQGVARGALRAGEVFTAKAPSLADEQAHALLQEERAQWDAHRLTGALSYQKQAVGLPADSPFSVEWVPGIDLEHTTFPEDVYVRFYLQGVYRNVLVY
jgi:hypothetical protein